MSVDLTNEQILSIYKLENWYNGTGDQVIGVAGKPGTGKTFLIRYFIERIGLNMNEVLFLAYMGKAVTVMQKNGLPAQTVHSAIYNYVKKIARDEDGHIIFKENGKPKTVMGFELKDHLPKKIKLIVIDEASMINKQTGEDILSFGIPVITIGDLNQLPPVMGKPFFLVNPEINLTQIMRQAEGNPIIWMENEILDGRGLRYGVYGNSAVIPRRDLTDFQIKNADIILTGTNKLRYTINCYCREALRGIKKLEYPHVNEKVICRKNNWDRCIDGFYLTNGMTGFVDCYHHNSFNKRTAKMDFRPDFLKKTYKNVEFDYKHMYAKPNENEDNSYGFVYDKMEYAYAITVHSSQGSTYQNVLFLYEDFMSVEDNKKLLYTAISRASDSVIVVM